MNKYLDRLKAYCAVPPIKIFKQFRDGLIYFTVGLIAIYLANVAMPPSTLQEVVVLLGLCLGSLGFILAMLAQARMIISRIYAFFSK